MNKILSSVLLLTTVLCFANNSVAQNSKLVIGTYTNKNNSQGIYIYNFNSNTGTTAKELVIKNIANPSYLTLSSDKKTIYAVSENGKNSNVSAFNINGSPLNGIATQGADPCYVTTSRAHVFAANYTGGSINVFGIKKDGSLSELLQTLQHTGKGLDKRQQSAHVHQVMLSPDGKYLLATDLGEDAIYVYKYNSKALKPLTFHQVFKTNASTGPRHITFNKNGNFIYLTNEFDGKISTYSYHKGNIALLQQVSTADANFKGNIDGADIHTSADGKFLYQTNRGDLNTINVFAIAKNGTLTHVQTTSTLGKGPRNFAIDLSGKFLLVAHQYSNNVVIFNRDIKTGKLSDSENRIDVGAPVCLVFSK